MTTVADILAASDVAMDEIWRDANGYVSIQDEPPWVGYFGGTYVQHCGISVGRVYYLAGLVMGRDFPDLSYTPTGAQATFDGATTPRRRHELAGSGCGQLDHLGEDLPGGAYRLAKHQRQHVDRDQLG